MAEWMIDGPGIALPSDAVLLDEARHGAVRRTPRPRLAIRLLEMVVHENGRWFGESHVRLDVLVVHGGSASGTEYAPQTFAFPRVADGDRLPIGQGGLLLFHGRPKWFLSMFVALSRDVPGAPGLPALLNDIAASDPAVELQAQALSLATGLPDPDILGLAVQGTWAVGGAALARLTMETRSTIGVYRDSWLRGRDSWGVGRHPHEGLLRAKDVSFAFEIIEENEE
ncbi:MULTISPECIES: hypothetical protein [unclassified Streptomyces]|uniref:hypothetical protein n=1 Tax=unclassified Streptomyces TaxID=2593676 RepID=UPI003324D414